ncbi:K1C18 protein, partial [Chroicocephalus maculipennis]|nr:K1C18 protein [Chroicocephalus maculipennis]
LGWFPPCHVPSAGWGGRGGSGPGVGPPNHTCVSPPQITESTIEITQSSKDIDTARSTVVDLRRSVQTLEIDLESLHNQKAGLEANLLEVENRYGAQLEQLNGLVLRAEAELLQVRTELQRQAEEYQALLNVKGKLEAEIATYRQLLEGGEEFR